MGFKMNITYAIVYVARGYTYHVYTGAIQHEFDAITYVYQEFEDEHGAVNHLEKLLRDYYQITKTEQGLYATHKNHSFLIRNNKKSPHADDVVRLVEEVDKQKSDFQSEYGLIYDNLELHNSANHFQIHKKYNYDETAYRGYP